MTLVIMAAGMGSRFGGLKQIEPIDEYGNFIIDYSIYDAIKVGFTKVVFIIKKENYDIFRETVGARVEKHIEVEYVFQELDNLPEGFNSWILSYSDEMTPLYRYQGFTVLFEYIRRAIGAGLVCAFITISIYVCVNVICQKSSESLKNREGHCIKPKAHDVLSE